LPLIDFRPQPVDFNRQFSVGQASSLNSPDHKKSTEVKYTNDKFDKKLYIDNLFSSTGSLFTTMTATTEKS